MSHQNLEINFNKTTSLTTMLENRRAYVTYVDLICKLQEISELEEAKETLTELTRQVRHINQQGNVGIFFNNVTITLKEGLSEEFRNFICALNEGKKRNIDKGNLYLDNILPEFKEIIDEQSKTDEYYLLVFDNIFKNNLLTPNAIKNQHKYRLSLLSNVKEKLDNFDSIIGSQLVTEEQALTIPQTFEGGQTYYLPLGKSVPTIAISDTQESQQLQMQLAQEEQQEQEQAQEQELENFDGEISGLIARDNCSSTELFNDFVGSDKDESEIISYMTKQAYDKLMLNKEHFCGGILTELLPPGFYLAKHITEHGLILGFSALREAKELSILAQTRRDPLQMVLPRSFEKGTGYPILFSDITNNMQLRQAHFSDKINNEDNNSVAIKYLQFLIHQTKPEIIDKLFQSVLINKKHSLLAFGQLYYYYGLGGIEIFLSLAEKLEQFNMLNDWISSFLNKTDNWANCINDVEVSAILDTIITFNNMKKISPTVRSSSSSSSSSSSADNDIQRFWWQFINAHKTNAKQTEYSALWRAYGEFIKLVHENKSLRFDIDKLILTIEKNKFNGFTFLYFLRYTLNKAAKESDSLIIQQDILNNVDQIDWKRSGFYSANRNSPNPINEENYPFWSKSLQLTNFNESYPSKSALGYVNDWDYESPGFFDRLPQDIYLYALRFAVQKIRFSFHTYKKLERIVLSETMQQHVFDRNALEMSLRILIGFIAFGRVDDSLDASDYTRAFNILGQYRHEHSEFINSIDKLMPYAEGGCIPGYIHLRLKDLATFIEVMVAAELGNYPITLEQINEYGRVLWYLKDQNQKDAFTVFIKENKIAHYEGNKIADFPWITGNIETYSSFEKECAYFRDQLYSIDFDKTPYDFDKTPYTSLPNRVTLESYFSRIKDSVTPFTERNNVIKELESNNCVFSLQSRPYIQSKIDPNSFIQTLKPAFIQENQPLFQRLMESHIAVEEDVDPNKAYYKLFSIFELLDNDVNYNNLGQLLGLLNERASPDKKYALNQLLQWLPLVISSKTNSATRPYPVELLDAILANNGKESTLLNSDISLLRSDAYNKGLFKFIASVSQQHYMDSYKAKLISIAMHEHEDEAIDFLHHSNKLLVNLHRNSDFIFSAVNDSDFPFDNLSLINKKGIIYYRAKYYRFDFAKKELIELDLEYKDSILKEYCLNADLLTINACEKIRKGKEYDYLQREFDLFIHPAKKQKYADAILKLTQELIERRDILFPTKHLILSELSQLSDFRFKVSLPQWIEAQTTLIESFCKLKLNPIDIHQLLWESSNNILAESNGKLTLSYNQTMFGFMKRQSKPSSKLLEKLTYSHFVYVTEGQDRGLWYYEKFDLGNLQSSTSQKIARAPQWIIDSQQSDIAQLNALQMDSLNDVQKRALIDSSFKPKGYNISIRRASELDKIAEVKYIGNFKYKSDGLTNPVSVSPKLAFIRVIIAAAVSESNYIFAESRLTEFKNKLDLWSEQELRALQQYCSTKPRPNFDKLFSLLSDKPEERNTKFIIDKFVDMDYLRHFINSGDEKGVSRVLNRMKIKGKGPLSEQTKENLHTLLLYIDSIARRDYEERKDLVKLVSHLNSSMNIIKDNNKSIEEQSFAKAVWLSKMRDIALLTTNKWLKYTQTLDLLFAILNSNTSHIHQLGTGEGKSIISSIVNIFDASMGKNVFCFTAKEALSERDHDESAPLLDVKCRREHDESAPLFNALGIRHSYINANSNPSEFYQNLDEKGRGAIHFGVTGPVCLFFLKQISRGTFTNKSLAVFRENMVAWVDEIDVLNDDNVVINLASAANTISEYDPDAWVIRVAYDYYRNHVFEKTTTDLVIKPEDLVGLYNALLKQKNIEGAVPNDSMFWQSYIQPAASRDPKAIEICERELLKLITAIHTASRLEKDTQFCVHQETIMLHGVTKTQRTAKILMSDNQIKEGSIYSEGQQKGLCQILNTEGAENGMRPNFALKSSGDILLSLNTQTFLTTFFSLIKGCTGTAGSIENELKFYHDLGINTILKLPTHTPRNIDYRPTIFAIEHYAAIVDEIRKIKTQNPTACILVACENDVKVGQISKEVMEQLSAEINPSCFFVDTNASMLSESETIVEAAKPGVVTFSSRISRGTHIETENLHVIITFTAHPRIIKQTGGRTGRGGKSGYLISIIDYAKVQANIERLNADEKIIFDEFYVNELNHLNKKIEKHQSYQQGKEPKTDFWLSLDDNTKEQMVKTAALTALKIHLERKNRDHLKIKESFKINCNKIVIAKMLEIALVDSAKVTRLQDMWRECAKEMDGIWIKLNHNRDKRNLGQDFLEEAELLWDSFVREHELNNFDSVAVSVNHAGRLLIESDELVITKEMKSQVLVESSLVTQDSLELATEPQPVLGLTPGNIIHSKQETNNTNWSWRLKLFITLGTIVTALALSITILAIIAIINKKVEVALTVTHKISPIILSIIAGVISVFSGVITTKEALGLRFFGSSSIVETPKPNISNEPKV